MKYTDQVYSQNVAPNDEVNGGKQLRADSSLAGQQKRLHYLDWLRVLAVLGVFYAHTIYIFNLVYWHVNNDRGLVLVVFGTEWGMALFFLLAGATAWFSLGSRTSRQFISERFARLVIPFVTGVILLSPVQGYLLDLSLSLYHGSFFQYYPYFFRHIQFSWNPQLLAAYGFHLWFLGFLFLFSVIALAPFIYLKNISGQRVMAWLAAVCERRGGVFIFMIPLALIQLALRPAFPVYQGWTDFLSWFVFFVYGYLLVSDARLMKAIQKQGMIAFFVGIVSIITLLVTMYGPGFLDIWEGTPGYSIKYELDQLLLTIIAWSLMLFVLYFGMRFLNVSNKLIQYANEAVLPFYVLHFFVIVVIVFFVARWNIAMAPRFLVVSTLSLAMTLVVYELLVRRVTVVRWLFGMKPKR